MLMITVFLVCCVIGAIVEWAKKPKTIKQTIAPANQIVWADFGPTMEIMGKTFVREGGHYTYKDLYTATTTTGITVYGADWGKLTKSEFITLVCRDN